ncbi:uncharacterized protein LOC129600484 [Paramacrobiotus metropolitanus]|uniref:uncharacterized protein LOC129600484 n=1 Tax=Paramacrobiotus metropolitanus TaxID=2943436 RepID=UPI0024459D1E|nr:uncharacterized protein LOC129600484 [Paramacrobiotus metropolitanus]
MSSLPVPRRSKSASRSPLRSEEREKEPFAHEHFQLLLVSLKHGKKNWVSDDYNGILLRHEAYGALEHALPRNDMETKMLVLLFGTNKESPNTVLKDFLDSIGPLFKRDSDDGKFEVHPEINEKRACVTMFNGLEMSSQLIKGHIEEWKKLPEKNQKLSFPHKHMWSEYRHGSVGAKMQTLYHDSTRMLSSQKVGISETVVSGHDLHEERIKEQKKKK